MGRKLVIIVIRYDLSKKKDWNDFLEVSKNGHFMFNRDYMDYHHDRFNDHSLMFYDEKNRLVGLFPANLSGRTLHSHQGLTFGGLLLSRKSTSKQVNLIFFSIVSFLKSLGTIDTLVYKRIPDFYHTYPSQEDLYSLFLLDAKLIRRDLSVAIDLFDPQPYQEMRQRKLKKAESAGVTVLELENFVDFWFLLEQVLFHQHNVKPVHSISEIQLLKSKFPGFIKCFVAYLNGELLAGTVVFQTKTVAHTQYLAASEQGKDIGALDMVINFLIKTVYKDKRYFDFGISTENAGRTLNMGLVSQKEGFGARGVVHDFYELAIK